MNIFISPWFLTLNTISLLIMFIFIIGLLRACKRHNKLVIGRLSEKVDHFPNSSMIIALLVYGILSVAYVIAPTFVHFVIL